MTKNKMEINLKTNEGKKALNIIFTIKANGPKLQLDSKLCS